MLSLLFVLHFLLSPYRPQCQMILQPFIFILVVDEVGE